MAAIELVDFVDIYTAVQEAVKVQSTDTTNVNRIKRWVNMTYLNKVVPIKRWWWLRDHTTINIVPKVTTGTVSVTQDSPTIIFSDTITPTIVGQYINFNNDEELYRIDEHTGGTDTATLDADYIQDTNATSTYQRWDYVFALPADFKEGVEVYTDRRLNPMQGVGIQEFRRFMQEFNKREAVPFIYSVSDFNSTGSREILFYPALSDERTVVQIDYIKEAVALDLDGDEPQMPVEDRIVLFHGALVNAWKFIARNLEESQLAQAEFNEKLSLMMADAQDSVDLPSLSPSRTYLMRKRIPNRLRRRFNSRNFLKD